MESDSTLPSTPESPFNSSAQTSRPRGAVVWKIVVCALIGLGGFILVAHSASHGKTIPPGQNDAILTVPVIKVDREDLSRSESFDAEFRPYQVIDLHAEVAGFVKSINVDIGDQVKQGDLLATLEIPELPQEIERAEAAKVRDEKKADQAAASYEDAHLSWTRLEKINESKAHLISQQDLDTARAKNAAADANLAAAKEDVKVSQAELDRLMAIQNDCKIIAPFPGVITKRYADVGALVQGGVNPSGSGMPLVRLSENARLRLDFPVSVSYVQYIKSGVPVEIQIAATGRILHSKISRFTHNVDMATRTMDSEIDVPNEDLSLTPGVYASVRLELERHANTLTVPGQALSNLKSPTALVVNDRQEIEERRLTIGLATPDRFEVLSGLKENDMVVIGNRSQIKVGQKVEIKLIGKEDL